MPTCEDAAEKQIVLPLKSYLAEPTIVTATPIPGWIATVRREENPCSCGPETFPAPAKLCPWDVYVTTPSFEMRQFP
jgi:hypothetical protein